MEPEVSRRTLLGSTAAVAAVGAIAVTTGEAEAAETYKPKHPLHHDLRDIKHVVVIMQENRSFDHYYGTLRGVRGFDDRAVLTQPRGQSVFHQPNGWPATATAAQYPYALSEVKLADYPEGLRPPTRERGAQNYTGTAHGWTDQHKAWFGGWMNGWVWGKGSFVTLGYLKREDLPFNYALADAYTIGDAYHCSVISQTGPNRTYLWSGTINASADHDGSTFVAYTGASLSGDCDWRFYVEDLQDAGVDWRVYQCVDDYGDAGSEYTPNVLNAPHDSELWKRGVATVPEPKKGLTANADNLALAIKNDVKAGKLPQVSYVVSNQLFSEHPDAAAINGGYLVGEVLKALNADEDVFNSTLVIVNYDENDGQFDHVPPPVAPAGEYDETHMDASWTTTTTPVATPVGLGFRVPLMLLSPWTRGGWVYSETSDHTSVIRFLETWTTAIGKPAASKQISPWRRRVCSDLTRALDFAKPVYGLPKLPFVTKKQVVPYPKSAFRPDPDTNQMPKQEKGTRPSRALAYQPNASIAIVAGAAQITLANTGAYAHQASHFAIYDQKVIDPDVAHYPTGFPTQVTVDAKQTATSAQPLSGNAYDFTVTGPQRFLRRFSGDVTGAGAEVEATVAYKFGKNRAQSIVVTVTNAGDAPASVSVKPQHYATGKAFTLTVPAGGTATRTISLSGSHGWYDLMLTQASDHSWHRRFTGHVENGLPSISG